MPRLALEVQFVLVELSESRNSNRCCTESCMRVVLMIYFRQPLEAMVTSSAAALTTVPLLIFLIVLAVVWRLAPTKFRLSFKLTKWMHLELESKSEARRKPARRR